MSLVPLTVQGELPQGRTMAEGKRLPHQTGLRKLQAHMAQAGRGGTGQKSQHSRGRRTVCLRLSRKENLSQKHKS